MLSPSPDGDSGQGSPEPAEGTGITTVVIVTYRSSTVLSQCLDALPAAFDGAGAYQVVVVDNASGDDTVGVAQGRLPAARVIQLPANRGYAAGINAALDDVTASGPVLVLNPDVRLRPRAARALLAALERPGTGITVPRIVDADGVLQWSLRREPTLARALGEALIGGNRAGRFLLLGEMVVGARRYRGPATADWATGAVMLLSRPCLEATGRWDESFFLYSEETDFALRARDAGFALRYVPEAEAVHLGGESNTSPRLWALLTVNRVRLYRRRRGAARGALFGLVVLLNEALRALTGDPRHRAAIAVLVRPSRRPPELESGRDGSAPAYVCFAAQDWWYHNRAHSDFQLMRRVAAHRRVLVVNSIGMRMPLPGRSASPLRRVARKVGSVAKGARQPIPALPNFWVMSPVSIPLHGSVGARAINAWIVRLQVSRTANRLAIVDPILFLTIPTAWDVARGMRRRALVYNRSDKHSAFPEADTGYIEGLEHALLRHADSVVYASQTLMEEEAALTDTRARFLDHGVDLAHFSRVTPGGEPDDLRHLPRPRLGFFGALDPEVVDFALLEHVARAIPDASVVLIGNATFEMEGLERLPNVHWLGFRAYEQLPRYGAGFDVGLMPWARNEWIRHCNPIKLKEYLALGLPVVTTDFPEARRYQDVLSIAHDSDEFVELVREALAASPGSSREMRTASVADASWERQAARLMSMCEEAPGGG